MGKTLGVERVVRQKVQALPFHLAAMVAVNTPHLQFEEHPRVSAGQIANPANLAVIPSAPHATAATTCRFFERRFSVMTRAFGSPKMPTTKGSTRKPGNEYVSNSRRRRFDALAIRNSCQISNTEKWQNPSQ